MLSPGVFFHLRTVILAGRLFFWVLVLLAASFQATQAQSQKDKENQKSQDDVITLKTHLVTMDVIVKDKKGKYLTDIKAQDFTVFENGVQQKVEFFDPPLVAVGEADKPKSADSVSSVKSSGRPTNILSLVLDGATTDMTNLKQVRDGTLSYIRERIADNDAVAVFGVSTDLQLLQPFTNDKAKLIAAVESAYLLSGSNKNLERSQVAEDIERARADSVGPGNLPQSAAAAPLASAAAQAMIASRALEQFIKLRAQLSAQQARPVLAALAAICEAQRIIPGKKTLVLFSQGFVAPTILDWQVQSVIDIANRANVAIYVIDSAGLRTSTPQSTSPVPAAALAGVSATMSTETRMRAVGGENVFDNVRHEGLSREYDILYRVSGDTGGEFIKGSNDLAKGLDRIDSEIRSRYTLAYYSTDSNFDGGFRKVKVEVGRPETHVISRSGYYANASDEIVPLSPDEKKLLANVAAFENNPALPLFVELSPFRSSEGRYMVPLSIEMPPSAVKFDRKGDKQHVEFEVLGVIREAPDKIIGRLGGEFDIGLTTEQYQAILKNNISYRQDIELAPGSYNIELIVRDKLSGRMAGRRERLVLHVADTEFSTTGAVLSRHAAASSSPPGAAESGDVFTQGGVQIRPFPGRTFRATDNLIIFFELYNAAVNAERGKPLVRVTVRLMKDDKAASKPIDYVLTETLTKPVPHLTFAKYVSLAGLPAGKYTAMIEAVDMVTHKLVKQEAAFAIVE